MDAPSIPCSKCRTAMSSDAFRETGVASCGSCGSIITAFLFPALFSATLVTQAPESLLTDGEASCFFHPSKKAVVACAGCGRFLCGLCDLEWQDQHLCASCLEAGKKKGKIKSLENHRVLYDQIALSLAIVPLLLWPFTCLTAPVALYMVIRYWGAPSSLLPRTKFRFIVAGLFAVGEIGGWIWFLAVIFHVASK